MAHEKGIRMGVFDVPGEGEMVAVQCYPERKVQLSAEVALQFAEQIKKAAETIIKDRTKSKFPMLERAKALLAN